jgi:putative transposase
VAPAPDRVDRDFTAEHPDQVWLADITQFRTIDGVFYVAGVLDIATKRLVGWSMSNRQTSTLVIDAMVMAATRRDQTSGVVHHSDRGSQYTSMAFTDRLADLEIVASFGSVGDCYDNAPMESFWATMKREMAWIHGDVAVKTRGQLRAVIFDYIEVFYNRQRHQAGLNHMTPQEYEQAITAA